MALSLRTVPAAQGLRWAVQGFQAFAKSPFAFSGMFAAFLVVALFCSMVPYLGGMLVLMALPLLSLAYMLATHAVLKGGAVQVAQLFEPLRGPPARRKSLLQLCGLYAVLMLLIMLLGDAIDGGAFNKLQVLMAKGEAARTQVNELLADPSLANGIGVRLVLIALLSVPFWHAPSLVFWGGQGVAQSLFSSTLALWRNRGAVALYSLAFMAAILSSSLLLGTLLTVVGVPQLAGLLAVPAGLVFSAVFYASLWFVFKDSFGVELDPAVNS
jgi:hypothetical protein